MQNTYLVHHGTKGQKWGVRRYQNPDGTLTPEGRSHYKSLKQNLKDSKLYYDVQADFANKAAVPISLASGAALLFSTSAMLPLASAVGVGALGSAVAYGAWKGDEAFDHWMVDRLDKKISEIDTVLNR